MSKCVAAGIPAGVVACTFFTLSGAVLAQDISPEPVPSAVGTEAQTGPSRESAPDQTADAEPGTTTDSNPSGGDVTLPQVVVSPPTWGGSASGPSTYAGGSGGGGAAGAGAGSGGDADEGGSDGIVLGGGAVADTGMTVFDARNVQIRSDGSGDANTFMRNLPNVQFQNDTDEDPGVNLYELIDTRPLELSISGAQTYENNFILNGISISNITGPVEPQGNDDLEDEGDDVPNLNSVYGQHSQTVYVPSEFIGTATLIDSNASAEYGQFQGGVVLYDLALPPKDGLHTFASYSRHTDKMVDFLLATPSGSNPLDRVAPTFTRESFAASAGAPITSEFGFILQASRKTAETIKQKEYTLHGAYGGYVEEESDNIFLRFASELETDIGRFTFDTSHTNYSQLWQSDGWRNLEMDARTESSTTRLEYLGDLPELSASGIGLGGIKLKSTAYYNDSDTINDTTDGPAFAWVAMRRTNDYGAGWETNFETDAFADWCREDPEDSLPVNPSRPLQDNTICNEGGYDDKEMGQTDVGVQAQLRGNLLFGRFLLGGEAKSVEGRRARPSDFVYYTSFVTITGDSRSPDNATAFNCPPGDEACTEEQFARIKVVSEAFDVQETINALHGYAEIDQMLGWFNVRAGVRVDYEDYFKQLNLAPRLVATITPFPGLSVSGGFNRYYLGETLYYALRDSQPYSRSYSRGTDDDGNVDEDYVGLGTQRIYGFKDSGVTTPFTDEYTGAVRLRDPVLGGNWRVRYLERYGRDQFASVSCGSGCSQMTNDGDKFYRSASAEYAKAWRTPSAFYLDSASFSLGATWAERSISRSTYADDDESDDYIWYGGESYTKEGFTAVSGNLDIPIRIGATFSTSWFGDSLWLALSAGYNLGYEGVYDTGVNEIHTDASGVDRQHDVYEDRSFDAVLQLDLDARYYVTEQAYVNLHVNNLLNTAGNKISTNDHPWVLGRSVWVESGVRF